MGFFDRRSDNSGDWHCHICHYRNFRKNGRCRQCRALRHGVTGPANASIGAQVIVKEAPSSIKVRGDDWFCSNCKAHQFARNTECRDCKTPKPNEENIDQQKCVICCTNQRNSSLNHGNTAHVVTCYECGLNLKSKLGKCPVCRQIIQNVIKLYD